MSFKAKNMRVYDPTEGGKKILSNEGWVHSHLHKHKHLRGSSRSITTKARSEWWSGVFVYLQPAGPEIHPYLLGAQFFSQLWPSYICWQP